MAVVSAGFVSVAAACTAAACAVPAGLAVLRRARSSGARAELDRLRLEHGSTMARLAELEAAAQQRDRAEAASEAKSRFLATVSHEIRTPLSGVLGIADLLAGTSLTREQQSYVAAVKTSGETLMTLIDDILDFARIEAGRLDLASEPFDPTALVEGVVELLAPRAHGKGLEIASFVSADVPVQLIGDPHRLRQVLLNLAGNAVKFTETGGVGVGVGRCRDGRVLFSVSDTGPGIAPGKRAIIFDEFEQADGSATRRHGGTGLGLAIVKRIVNEMGGELGVGDRAGSGALFAFRVPLGSGETRATDAAGSTNLGIVTGPRSLIVSAEMFQPAYLAGALQERGSEVVRVTSSVEAVALLQRPGQRFDTLFVDCGIGNEEARAVAAVGRLTGAKRTVLLFSPYERRQMGQPQMAGFDAWLVKPIRRASLAARFGEDTSVRKSESTLSEAERAPVIRTKVLLAEDNPINALIARTSLERLGAEVVHVTDGEAAWRAAQAALDADHPFDIALMDVSMPVLDGLEATRRIRDGERERSARPMRIVATTAHALADMRRQCETAGMDEVLTKPIDSGHLRRLVAFAPMVTAAAS